MSKFQCTNCGACCLNISMVPEMQDFVLPSGRCKNLDKDNKTCMIYDNRPILCRVDDLGNYLRLGSSWTALMHVTCNTLHEKVYGVPQEPLDQKCQHES